MQQKQVSVIDFVESTVVADCDQPFNMGQGRARSAAHLTLFTILINDLQSYTQPPIQKQNVVSGNSKKN